MSANHLQCELCGRYRPDYKIDMNPIVEVNEYGHMLGAVWFYTCYKSCHSSRTKWQRLRNCFQRINMMREELS